MHRQYELSFARSKVPLSKEDLEFGERYGLILTQKLQPRTDLLPVKELPSDWSMAHEKWRLVALLWAIENSDDDPRSLFDEVDAIWVHFEEPDDMRHLVSFMPTDDPFASEETLKRKILDFVDRKKAELGLPRKQASH